MVGSDYTADVGSDFTPDVSTDAETINAQNAAINQEILRARPDQNTWLRRLAKTVGGDTGDQQTQQSQAQTSGQQQQKAQTAQQQATQATDPGPGAALSGAGYKSGPKSGQWQTSDPAAIGKGERAGRQSEAIGSLAHSVGTIIRLLMSYGAGGAMGGGGAGAAGGAAGAAGAFGGDTAAAGGTIAGQTGGAEMLTPGGSPETSAVGAYGGSPGLAAGGGSTGSGLSNLARQYFGGQGGDTYSNIMNIAQQANQMGGGVSGGAGGQASSGVGGWAPQVESEMMMASGKTQPRIKSMAEFELAQAGLTPTGGVPGGGSNIPWVT